MKAVQVIARGKAKFVDVPVPTLRPGHALVRAKYLSLCGSDIRMLHFAPEHEYPFPPGTTGHEMVGVVEAIDAPGSNIKAGDLVLALAPNHIAMAEYYLAPIDYVLPLPGGMPIEHLLQAQQLGTVIFACQRLPEVAGKSVAIIGQGSAGLYFNYHLRHLGAFPVVAIDLEERRLRLSREFGATHTIHNARKAGVELTTALREICGGELPEIVVEAAGEIETINLAIELVRLNGDILYFGYPRGQIFPFNFELLFHKCCHAHTIVGATVEPNQQSSRLAIDLVASGKIDVSRLITHRVPFANVLEAYEQHRGRGDECVKIVVEMPE